MVERRREREVFFFRATEKEEEKTKKKSKKNMNSGICAGCRKKKIAFGFFSLFFWQELRVFKPTSPHR